ncbi:MAG: mandelate racemase/muconate lactonizing enzyme family protein [Inquilinus sp.]|nr:mandelate racemase/muconate lactonizing enzyme family protein [Inquilinus sp.]
MRITKITSHVLQYDMPEELGYSQQFYSKRSAHLVEVRTDEGITGWGECFGPGNVAIANKAIVERVIAPMVVGSDPFDRERIWHHVYNLLRDHGQKGMPIQALSGVDIALWDIVGKATGLPLYKLVGGRCRDRIPVYGYGMMLKRHGDLAGAFADEAAGIEAEGFRAVKMKVGLGPREDIRLVEAVRSALSDSTRLMVDANHCYTTSDALQVGRALDALGVYWFEEPVAPEDRDGYRFLRDRLTVNISGGEAEFTRWGWRDLLAAGCVDIAQPEVCGLGGISEYLKVLALAHTHFVPVTNHVWGSAVAVAVNAHLLTAMPDVPGGLNPWSPMLEFDTTPNLFRDEMPTEPLKIVEQIGQNGGTMAVPDRPGIGVEPDIAFLERYAVT